MTKREHPRTTPSQAPGESGDREARREAEEAMVTERKAGEGGDLRTPNSRAAQRPGAKNAEKEKKNSGRG
ncbi:hypothetical protein [Streptomyces sp. SPB4]|uniref:hypothetical protein n=1 Tax=Streptomyces TaxID=1883 RepID=UPI00247378D5|nr:hypothetical protein [Streptomyces sp. SPB4]MDH6544054.1 hypothetical protein [Streptomyces sp. SPB4]